MCWNAEVSLQSFLVGIAAIGIAALKNKSIAALFFSATIVFMQLVEYVVWSNYDNKLINQLASMVGYGLLLLQPIGAIMTHELSTVYITVYVGLVSLGLLLGKFPDFSMTRAPNGHLAWNWLNPAKMNILLLITYFFFLSIPPFLKGEFWFLTVSTLTLVLSLYSYWKYNTWGSMWCWIVNGLVVLWALT